VLRRAAEPAPNVPAPGICSFKSSRECSPKIKLSPSYYRARYYDPSVGRFLSEDPARFRAGLNFYSYAGNCSTILRDPAGLWASGVGLTGAGNIGIFWRGAGVEGGFYRVTDALGNVGILDCRGVGIGAVNGVSAGVQVTTLICPNCRSICDMQGTFGGAQGFGGLGLAVSAGGGVTLSSSSATVSYGLGAGGGQVQGWWASAATAPWFGN
jgi:RHS repeat-associated protein